MKNAYLGFAVATSFFYGCTKNDDVAQGLTRNVKLQSIDTVNVEYMGISLTLADFKFKKFVFFDFFSKAVITTDRRGKILARFNAGELGANDAGGRILGIQFQEDTTLVLVSEDAYLGYSLHGRALWKAKHSPRITSPYITGDFKLRYDPRNHRYISLLTTSSNLPSSDPEFYKQIRHITTFQDSAKQYSHEIVYETESTFDQANYYTPNWKAHFDTNEKNLVLLQLNE